MITASLSVLIPAVLYWTGVALVIAAMSVWFVVKRFASWADPLYAAGLLLWSLSSVIQHAYVYAMLCFAAAVFFGWSGWTRLHARHAKHH